MIEKITSGYSENNLAYVFHSTEAGIVICSTMTIRKNEIPAIKQLKLYIFPSGKQKPAGNIRKNLLRRNQSIFTAARRKFQFQSNRLDSLIGKYPYERCSPHS